MCLNCWRDICNFKSVLLTPSWWAWHQQLSFPSGAFRGFCIRSGDLCCCHGNCSQHGEGEGAVKEQKEPWGRGLSKLWTHTVCFVVNEWMKMRLFVPSKTVAFPSPERSTGTGMHPQCSAQGWMLDEVVFSMVLLRVPLACGKGSLSRV